MAGQDQADIGGTMPAVSAGGSGGDVIRDHQVGQNIIDNATDNAGIRQDVKGEVTARQQNNNEAITNNGAGIAEKEKQVHDESQPLQAAFDTAKDRHQQAAKKEREESENFFAATPTEMMDEAKKMMDKQKGHEE